MSNAYLIKIVDTDPLIGETVRYIAAPVRGACTAWLKEKGYKKSSNDKDYWFRNSGQNREAYIIKAKAIQ